MIKKQKMAQNTKIQQFLSFPLFSVGFEGIKLYGYIFTPKKLSINPFLYSQLYGGCLYYFWLNGLTFTCHFTVKRLILL